MLGQLGSNHQAAGAVAGIEAEMSYLELEGQNRESKLDVGKSFYSQALPRFGDILPPATVKLLSLSR